MSLPTHPQESLVKVFEYLRSLPDNEIMDPVIPGLLLNELRRVKGFTTASLANIYRERSRRIRRQAHESQFGHDLAKMADVLNISFEILREAYWGIRTQVEPGEPALQAISEQSGLNLELLTSAYHEVHVETLSKPRKLKPRAKKKTTKAKKADTPRKMRRNPRKKIQSGKTEVNYISEKDTREMRLRYLNGEKAGKIARSFKRDAKLVSLILRNERHQERPYPGLGVLEPRRYNLDELLALRTSKVEEV